VHRLGNDGTIVLLLQCIMYKRVFFAIFCLNGLELDPEESWVIVATSRRLKKTVSDSSDVTRALEYDIYDMNTNKFQSSSLQYCIYLNPTDARYETH
jgi:hypothetical protein